MFGCRKGGHMQSKNKKLNMVAGTTALYCRLSRDEGADVESNSILNQKRMLEKKAKEYGLKNTRCYVDDGYTGTNFNRPGFQQMLDDIEAGYVTTVMVKDLSRLGRYAPTVGMYMDSYFPEHDVRFIAVNDLVDSNEGENEIAPFKNVMNEMYARDISKKVRSAHRIRGNCGEPLGQPPYGYIKDPQNKKKWIIEPGAAEIVREIFKMCIEGKGNETIARILSERKILAPTAYWLDRGVKRGGKKVPKDPWKWKCESVNKILSNQAYCGDVINFKTYSKNFRNKKRLNNPEENWVVFKDVHEPIIDREVFERVQQMKVKTKRRAPKNNDGEKHLLSDYLYCGDCHKKLWYHTNTNNKDIHFFSCSNYVKDYRGTCPTRHYIRADAIEQVVILEIRRLAVFLRDYESAFTEILTKKTNGDILAQQKYLQEEINKAVARNDKVSGLYEKLFEDHAENTVSDEWFMHMSQKYEAERLELKNKISRIRKDLAETDSLKIGQQSFINAVRRFLDIQVLTRPLLQELIDHIDVFETEGTGKNRTQRIAIYYRFVGYIEIPDFSHQMHNIKSDTRRGVAVEYVPQIASA